MPLDGDIADNGVQSFPTGGPAFPRSGWFLDNNYFAEEQEGMALRDYFAAAALQGCVEADMRQSPVLRDAQYVVSKAYQYADVMLAARELTKKTGVDEPSAEIAADPAESDCNHLWREMMRDNGKAYKQRCIYCGIEAELGAV